MTVGNGLRNLLSGNKVKAGVEIGLMRASLIMQNTAKELSPYLTGKLRQSITHDWTKLKQGVAIVGVPKSVPYGRIRNYINYKNPQTVGYLVDRAYKENEGEIRRIISVSVRDSLK